MEMSRILDLFFLHYFLGRNNVHWIRGQGSPDDFEPRSRKVHIRQPLLQGMGKEPSWLWNRAG